MTKTKRIQILCLLGAVTLLLSGCWTEAPVESANGLLGDQEPAACCIPSAQVTGSSVWSGS